MASRVTGRYDAAFFHAERGARLAPGGLSRAQSRLGAAAKSRPSAARR